VATSVNNNKNIYALELITFSYYTSIKLFTPTFFKEPNEI
jgi:hypothetical protein